MAQNQFREPQPERRSRRGAPAYRYSHLPHAESKIARLHRPGRPVIPYRSALPFAPEKYLNHLNCYVDVRYISVIRDTESIELRICRLNGFGKHLTIEPRVGFNTHFRPHRFEG